MVAGGGEGFAQPWASLDGLLFNLWVTDPLEPPPDSLSSVSLKTLEIP